MRRKSESMNFLVDMTVDTKVHINMWIGTKVHTCMKTNYKMINLKDSLGNWEILGEIRHIRRKDNKITF